MVFTNIKSLSRGITLVEIIVVIFIVVLFSTIVVFSFQKIQQGMALSRASYSLAQYLRKAQDLALSGAETIVGGTSVKIAGYGVYINKNGALAADFNSGRCKYGILVYADSCPPNNPPATVSDKAYTPPGIYNYPPCADVVIDCIDINLEKQGVYVAELRNINNSPYVSINFTPPNPTTKISSLASDATSIDIVLGLINSSQTRIVSLYTSGLIEVK